MDLRCDDRKNALRELSCQPLRILLSAKSAPPEARGCSQKNLNCEYSLQIEAFHIEYCGKGVECERVVKAKKNEREREDVIDNDRFVWGGAGRMPQQRVDAWVPEQVYRCYH